MAPTKASPDSGLVPEMEEEPDIPPLPGAKKGMSDDELMAELLKQLGSKSNALIKVLGDEKLRKKFLEEIRKRLQE